MYLEQLERWWAQVPPQRLLVLRSEVMFAHPGSVYDRVVAFLGLRSHPRSDFTARNVVPYAAMPEAARERLRRLYAEPNRRLEAVLGRELGWQ